MSIAEVMENNYDEIIAKMVEAHKEALNCTDFRFAIYLDAEDDYTPYIFEDIASGNSFPASSFNGGDVYVCEFCDEFFDVMADYCDNAEDLISMFKENLSAEDSEYFDEWLQKQWSAFQSECEEYGEEAEYSEFLNEFRKDEDYSLNDFDGDTYDKLQADIINAIISDGESEGYYESLLDEKIRINENYN